jgi:AcrR family transcriptional regulator
MKPGLRERKKQQTRLAISNIATQMFIERGFDRVTIAEVAEAAEVSANTIFNYFTTKEELFFDRGEESVGALSRIVKGRAIGESVLDALYRSFQEVTQGEGIPFGAKNREVFISTIEASSALKARMFLLMEQAEQDLAKTLIEETKDTPDEASAHAVAALVMGLIRRLIQEFRASVLRGEDVSANRAAICSIGERGFTMLRQGVGSYGPKTQ